MAELKPAVVPRVEVVSVTVLPPVLGLRELEKTPGNGSIGDVSET